MPTSPLSRPASILASSIAATLALSTTVLAQSNWTGTTNSDWNDPTNWTAGIPSGVNAIINTDTPNIATITVDIAATPNAIIVGDGAGINGVLRHRSGTAQTGAESWMYVGIHGGTGVYNLADSTTTGGALTGLGLGSGNMVIGNTGPGGRLYIGGADTGAAGGNGTVNVNTTGTLTIRNDLKIGNSGGTGLMNVDAGTITTGGWNYIGGNENGGGGSGTLKMSGGTLTNTGRTYVGQAGVTGRIELTGSGSYNNSNGDIFVVGEGVGSNGSILVNGPTAQLTSVGELWIGQAAGGNGTMTVSAGSVNVGNWLAVGRDGATGVLTINGTGLVQKTNTNGSLEITNANSATASGTVNIDGGTLRVNNITGSGAAGSTANLYLNGGILKPTVANGNFINGNVVPLIKDGGAVIDTDGFDIGIGKVLAPVAGATGGLTKNGLGTLTLSGANTYTGLTTVSGGTLVVTNDNFAGGGSSVGTGATLAFGNGGGQGFIDGPVALAGTLTFNRASDVLYTGTITGAGTVNKNNANTLTLGGTMTGFTGTTNVNAGILKLNTATGGAVAVNSGARLIPTDFSASTLNVGALSLNTNSTTDFEFDPFNATNDIINVTGGAGALSFGSAFTLNFFETGGFTPFGTNGVYTLFDYNTSFTGSLSNFVVGNPVSGKGYTLTNDPGTTTVRLTIGNVTLSEWNVDSGGLWTTPGNWTNGVPNSATAEAVFGFAIFTAPVSIDLNGDKTVGKLTFDNFLSYTLNGTGTLTLDNGLTAATITVNSGSHFIDVPIATTGNLSITTGFGAGIQLRNLSGGNSLSTNGNGAVTLNGTGGYSTTTINGGSLNVGNGGTSGSLGTGAVLVGPGATLIFNRSDATSVSNNLSGGGAVTVNGSGALTYTGTDTHTGPTTLTAGTYFQEGTINGSGTFNIDNTATFRASSNTTIAGDLNIANGAGSTGTLNLEAGSTTTVTGASFRVGQNGAGTLNINGGSLTVTSNNGFFIGDAAGAVGIVNQTAGTVNRTNGWFSIGGNGQGTYNISGGSLSATGDFNVADVGASRGTLNVSGTAQVTSTGTFFVGKNTGTTGLVNVSGGTITSNLFSIGGGNGSANLIGNGFVTITGGTVTSSDELWVGQGNGSNGVLDVSAGTVASNSWIGVGRQGGSDPGVTPSYGQLNLSGTGNVQVTAGNTRFFIIGSLGGTGYLNMTGGTLEATNGGDLRLSENTNGYGQANLSGGVVKVDRIVDNGATSYLYLNGSTLQPRISAVDYLQGLDTANVGPGGAIFDTNGNDITVAQLLTGTTGDGVLSIPITDGGAGYPAAPIVKITGDGTGASAVAKVVGGVLTQIVITNPGIGYNAGTTTVNLIDPGAASPATLDAPTVGANANTGGLVKNGAGTLTITASNTYGGPTDVNTGTLAFGASQTLSALNIGAGATVVLLETAPAPAAAFVDAPASESAAQVAAVPEPGALGLLAAGVLGVLGRRRRRGPRN